MFYSNWVSKSIIALVIWGAMQTSAFADGILTPGSAAVTGFSGVLATEDNNILFDNNGPSVRIITLPGSSPFGLREVSKPFTVKNSDVGLVFGIAIDNAAQPNIFVAATSAYGIAIYNANKGRLKKGEPGAQYMQGQFGPLDQGGESTSIWRIDGITGAVSLFANVVYNGIENKPASLGGLAFDPISNQLFVADRSTGMIHRFSMNGIDNGVYDHGTQGLSAVGLQPVPFDSSTLANISSPNFDTENPATWGFAPVARRVFALAVYEGRLYYSTFGSQIWSVGIKSSGEFANDPRLELDSPSLMPDSEISSIAFDQNGYLYIAERGAVTGDYSFINVANSGQNRIKRFIPKIPTDASPYFWYTPGSEYSIGMYPEYQNSDGGVALTCGRSIWMTGDHLLDNGSSGGFPFIDGLQGNDKSLVKPANTPPLQSWFVNYYDNQADPNSRGHMGAIVTRTICAGGYGASPPLGLLPPLCPPRVQFFMNGDYCPPFICSPWVDWSLFDWPLINWPLFSWPWLEWPLLDWPFLLPNWQGFPFPGFPGYESGCSIGCYGFNSYCGASYCSSPFNWSWMGCNWGCYGFRFVDGYCGAAICQPFFWQYGFCCPNNGFCVPPPPVCPPELTYADGQCIPPPPPCPPNQVYNNGQCTPICPPNQTYSNGECAPVCPPNQTYRDGQCRPPSSTCPPGRIYKNGHCITPPQCLNNQVYINGRCTTPPHCLRNETYVNGRCIKNPTCPNRQILVNGQCVPPKYCPNNKIYIDGRCVTPKHCGRNQIYVNGHCVTQTICGKNQRLVNGYCVTITQPHCGKNQRLLNGYCVNITQPTICKSNQQLVNGHCVTIQYCGSGQVLRNGKCVSINIQNCPRGTVMKYGHCMSIYETPKQHNTKYPSQPNSYNTNKTQSNYRQVTPTYTQPKTIENSTQTYQKNY